jgi:predicted nucleic acid-binding Zn ribbon protein
MNDKPLEACEKCQGSVRRLIGGGAGIIFKGSGFYVNDYKSGSSSVAGPKKSDACSSCNNGACANSEN